MTDTLHQVDRHAGRASFLSDVLDGLSRPRKEIPSKYLYDECGSELFERITELPEYYLTRSEQAIMSRHADAMAGALGPGCLLIEYGSGSSRRTRLLLNCLRQPAGYIPIDIAERQLAVAADHLRREYPDIPIMPLVADFTEKFEIPTMDRPVQRRVVYFPGSTIGNFHPAEAGQLLRHMGTIVGDGGAVLLGIDMHKSAAIIEPAYNDAQGVTAAFNLNLLQRINRELDADFDVASFEHRATFNRKQSRIEMELLSQREQQVRIDGSSFQFDRGESIVTEYSYKYRPEDFKELVRNAGFNVQDVWMDEGQLFSVQLLVRRPPAAKAS